VSGQTKTATLRVYYHHYFLPARVKVASTESAYELQICLEPQKKKTNRMRSIFFCDAYLLVWRF